MAILAETRLLELTTTHPFRIARSVHSHYDHWLVRLEHDGDVGWGEAASTERYGETVETVAGALDQIVPLLGDDPYAIHAIEARIAGHLKANPSAKTAVSMALHDLVARRHGLPLYRWFGLELDAIPPTSFTIGIDEPEVMREKVAEAEQYSILKIKMGFEGDIEVLEMLRRTTDKPIRVDANEGWTRREALDRLPALEELGVELLEQPLQSTDLDGLAAVAKATELPVAADESCLTSADLKPLIGVVDVINVKIAKCGSLAEARRTMEAAKALGFGVFLGCMVESSLGIASAAHLAPLADYVDLDGHLLLADDPFQGLRCEDGRVLPAPDAVGLGGEPVAARGLRLKMPGQTDANGSFGTEAS
ncbi:MAG: dipeptide epimerase, partial [Gemmatimonadetes bacterium]|nr:dipeptide epimerase [Gemmatimonadota bacterium]